MSILRVLLASLTSLMVCITVARAEVLPVEAYAKLPNVSSVTISPDGNKLAMYAGNTREERSIIIVDLTGSKSPVRIPTNGEAPVRVLWLANDRIGAYFTKFVSRFGGNVQGNQLRLVSISADGKDQVEISPAAFPSALLPDDPDHVLMSAPVVEQASSRSSSSAVVKNALYRVNIKTGRGSVVKRVGDDTVVIAVDQNNPEPYAIVSAEFERGTQSTFEYFRIEVPDGNRWKVIYELTNEPALNGDLPINLLGRGFNPDLVYFIREFPEDNTKTLYSISLKTGELRKEVSRPDVDVFSLATAPYTNLFLGVGWYDEVRRTDYFVPSIQSLMEQLQGAFPGSAINITSWDAAYQKYVVLVSGGTVAQSYFLFDGTTGQLALIESGYPDVPGEEVASVEYITYAARDGLEIPAYLTLPVGREARNLPLVMLPHGGPEARDVPGFDFWPQMLANRGYAVIQPQFRGSDGFGNDFIKAGHLEWGLKMQTDLTDGVRHLVQEGIVDPERVSIFGWSYGGFASLAGLTLDAETYRCAVAGAPVSDPMEMLNWVMNTTGARNRGNRGRAFEYWTSAIGDLRDDREKLLRTSPIENIANVRGPLLLIHGDRDTTVPIEQSEIMFEAMKEAGKEVELVVLKDETHNIQYGETRVQMMEALDTFMRRCNPPN